MKKAVLRLIILVFFIAISSCQHSETSDNSPEINETSKIKHEFSDLLERYIKAYDGNFIDESWLYYNVFFFDDSGTSYLTIWSQTIYPKIGFFKDKNKVNCLECVTEEWNRKIVILTNQNKNLEDFVIIDEDCQQLAKEEKSKEYLGPIYDGSNFMKTYKIVQKDTSISFVEIDSVISPYRKMIDKPINE